MIYERHAVILVVSHSKHNPILSEICPYIVCSTNDKKANIGKVETVLDDCRQWIQDREDIAYLSLFQKCLLSIF